MNRIQDGNLSFFIRPVIILGVISCLLALPPTASGDETQRSSVIKGRIKEKGVDPETLNHAIEKVLKQSEFTWRLPRHRNAEKKKDLQDHPWPLSMLVAFGNTLEKWFISTKQWLQRLSRWFDDWFGNDDQDKKTPSDHSPWIGSARSGMLLLAVLLAGIGIVLFWKTWRQRHKPALMNVQTVTNEVAPDLNDENIKADLLPSDRWIALAQSLLREGTLRQAMRAFYLATLAHLSEQGFITIRKYKSDGEYIRELKRRAHTQTDLLAAFTQQVKRFDGVWYGMHRVTTADMNNFIAMQERIMRVAETV